MLSRYIRNYLKSLIREAIAEDDRQKIVDEYRASFR